MKWVARFLLGISILLNWTGFTVLMSLFDYTSCMSLLWTQLTVALVYVGFGMLFHWYYYLIMKGWVLD